MHCRPELRRRLRSLQRILPDIDGVVAVDEVDRDPSDRPTLEVVLAGGTGGLPPAAADLCATYGLTVRSVAPQGDAWVAVLVA